MADDPTLARRREEIRHRGIVMAASIATLVVLLRYVPWTSDLFIFPLLESFAYDMAYDYSDPDPPDDLLIVTIDDTSLQPQYQGRWPWSRRTHAELVRALKGARVIAFDVIFAESEEASGSGRNPDREFARVMREAGNVVLAAHRAPEMEYGGDAPDVNWGYPRPSGRGAFPIVQAHNIMPPISPLAEAAAAIGYVDIAPDPDGVFRRVQPLRMGSDGVVYPHFATAIAQLASGAPAARIVDSAADGAIEIAEERCPLDSHGEMLIDYSGPTGTIDHVAAWKVLEGLVEPSRWQDRIVLIGATAPGLSDIRPAPYRSTGREFFGVETNANIVNSLLHSGARASATRSLAWALFALGLGLAVGWLAWSFGDTLGPLLGALLLVGVAVPSFFVAFSYLDSIIPYGAILLAPAIPLAIAIPERLGRDKKVIQDQFSAYVSPDVLRQLTEEPELVARGARREVTLLFADVRGSTSLSESTAPEIWMAQLNEYLSQMSDAVFEYDGYLDKFMGDGIMVLWNAFGNQPDHADLAMQASLEMLRRLEVLNDYWERHEQRTPFRIGIAIHSGEAIVGNVGSDQRTQYTAIGDSVNTAARIEGMTKLHGRQFLASETSAARLSPEIAHLTEIGEVEVRGRVESITIFGLADEEPITFDRPAEHNGTQASH